MDDGGASKAAASASVIRKPKIGQEAEDRCGHCQAGTPAHGTGLPTLRADRPTSIHLIWKISYRYQEVWFRGARVAASSGDTTVSMQRKERGE